MKKVLKVVGWTFLGLLVVGNLIKLIGKPIYENSFTAQVAKANRDCPIPIGGGAGEVAEISIDGRFVLYRLNYRTQYYNAMTMAQSQNEIKEVLMMALLCMNGQGNNQGDVLVDKLIEEGFGLRFVITDDTGRRFECSATDQELEEMRHSYNQNPHEAMHRLLELQMAMERTSLPVRIDDGIMMTNYDLNDDNIIITIEMDEGLYSIDDCRANSEQIKSTMISEGLHDPQSKSLFDLCKVSHTGLVYRIKGSRGQKQFDILITSNEIQQFDITPSTLNIQ